MSAAVSATACKAGLSLRLRPSCGPLQQRYHVTANSRCGRRRCMSLDIFPCHVSMLSCVARLQRACPPDSHEGCCLDSYGRAPVAGNGDAMTQRRCFRRCLFRRCHDRRAAAAAAGAAAAGAAGGHMPPTPFVLRVMRCHWRLVGGGCRWLSRGGSDAMVWLRWLDCDGSAAGHYRGGRIGVERYGDDDAGDDATHV